ncbi:MAG TPA: hypothetical protein VIK89_14200 [Cytophagaceae bacterium]
MRLAVFILLFISCTFFSCNKDSNEVAPEEFEVYTILKGEHNSNSKISLINSDEISFLVQFDNSCKYTTQNPANQADINKLYGLSDCGSQHHENSARFGWRWYEDKLEILAYCYVEGERDYKPIKVIQPNQTYSFKLKIAEDQYYFSVDDTTVAMKRGCNYNKYRYRLYPYFGGDEVAPQDIHIKIKES